MTSELTADEVRSLLKLEPNATCGFVRLTFLSKRSIGAGGLAAPFEDGRPLGSALYFMVTPNAPVRLDQSATTSSTTIISVIRSSCSRCTVMAPPIGSSSARTLAAASACSY